MLEKLFNLPYPIQILMDPASIIVISIYFVLMAGERLFPGRPLANIRFWKMKGIMAFIFYFYLSTYLPLLWNEYLVAYQLIDMISLGHYWGALVPY